MSKIGLPEQRSLQKILESRKVESRLYMSRIRIKRKTDLIAFPVIGSNFTCSRVKAPLSVLCGVPLAGWPPGPGPACSPAVCSYPRPPRAPSPVKRGCGVCPPTRVSGLRAAATPGFSVVRSPAAVRQKGRCVLPACVFGVALPPRARTNATRDRFSGQGTHPEPDILANGNLCTTGKPPDAVGTGKKVCECDPPVRKLHRDPCHLQ